MYQRKYFNDVPVGEYGLPTVAWSLSVLVFPGTLIQRLSGYLDFTVELARTAAWFSWPAAEKNSFLKVLKAAPKGLVSLIAAPVAFSIFLALAVTSEALRAAWAIVTSPFKLFSRTSIVYKYKSSDVSTTSYAGPAQQHSESARSPSPAAVRHAAAHANHGSSSATSSPAQHRERMDGKAKR
ncbi:MAG: hypothetical protein V4490_00115 [Pseudomonadota bacterium]